MTVASPCTKVCSIDPATRICRGCARSIDEITAWASMSVAEQRALLVELATRQVTTPA
ncbi:MAG: DUF1289 domain-containing protein [Pseudomonadota bacterium]